MPQGAEGAAQSIRTFTFGSFLLSQRRSSLKLASASSPPRVPNAGSRAPVTGSACTPKPATACIALKRHRGYIKDISSYESDPVDALEQAILVHALPRRHPEGEYTSGSILGLGKPLRLRSAFCRPDGTLVHWAPDECLDCVSVPHAKVGEANLASDPTVSTPWIERGRASLFASLANGLDRDIAAVRATTISAGPTTRPRARSPSSSWSNGRCTVAENWTCCRLD